MPLYEYRCAGCGWEVERYTSTSQTVDAIACERCMSLAPRRFPLPNMLQFFSESSGRVIQNLDPGRVIHSHGEHQRLMKEKGVDYATDWHVSARPSRM